MKTSGCESTVDRDRPLPAIMKKNMKKEPKTAQNSIMEAAMLAAFQAANPAVKVHTKEDVLKIARRDLSNKARNPTKR